MPTTARTSPPIIEHREAAIAACAPTALARLDRPAVIRLQVARLHRAFHLATPAIPFHAHMRTIATTGGGCCAPP